jgi:hypothetical protein
MRVRSRNPAYLRLQAAFDTRAPRAAPALKRQ